MANAAVFLLKALCIIIPAPYFVVQGLDSSWGYRGFNVKCMPGTRLTGGANLEVLHQVQSKSKCLKSCFANEDCQFVIYSPKTRECLLETGSAQGTVEDEDYLSCGPDINEVWDRTAITVELPTTTPLPTTQEPNECDSSPCQHGQCTDGWEMFTCTCFPGYSGTTCDININECASDPCVNGACNDGVNVYTCSCNSGYEGTRCETNINECSSSPCVNGACSDGVNQYTCSCNAGYEGTRCDININECASNPCVNGACNDGVNVYTCSCNSGYEGTRCETNINECSSSPCVNGACTDGVNQYTCSCNAGYGGTRCDIKPLRLVGGSSAYEGRVEIFHNNQWGTVCDDEWDLNDAHVVCRYLFYPKAAYPRSLAFYGQGTGIIYLDNVNCAGTETSLVLCSHRGWGISDCSHGEDAGVDCYQSGSIRLVGGSLPNEGRVEVYYSGVWGTVCDDLWDLSDGHVACRELGYPSAQDVLVSAAFGQGSGSIYLDSLGCSGSESSLGSCSHNGWGSHDCGHSEDAGVRCNVY